MRKNKSLVAGGFLIFAALAETLALVGCASPNQRSDDSMPALVLTPLSKSASKDARAEFRKTFCSMLMSESNSPCDSYLRKFSDEPNVSSSFIAPKLPARANVFFISGIFSECFPKLLLFGESREQLRKNGYTLIDIPILGRASSVANAKIIYETILNSSSNRDNGIPQIIISYSKGTTDLLTALNQYPDLSKIIDVVISVAGVVNGSPLADKLARFYSATFSSLPGSTCAKKDERELESLTTEVRLPLTASNKLPSQVKYFSIIAAPNADRVSRLLLPFYKELGKISWRNDGQVIAYDAVIPGSTVLGYLNADHFAVSLPITNWNLLVGKFAADKNRFPRNAALFAAIAIALSDPQ